MKAEEQGVVVRRVVPSSVASKSGLKRGDVILKGGNQPTRDVEELLAALAGAKQQIVLMIQRVGSMNRNLIALRLPGPKAAAAPR